MAREFLYRLIRKAWTDGLRPGESGESLQTDRKKSPHASPRGSKSPQAKLWQGRRMPSSRTKSEEST